MWTSCWHLNIYSSQAWLAQFFLMMCQVCHHSRCHTFQNLEAILDFPCVIIHIHVLPRWFWFCSLLKCWISSLSSIPTDASHEDCIITCLRPPYKTPATQHFFPSTTYTSARGSLLRQLTCGFTHLWNKRNTVEDHRGREGKLNGMKSEGEKNHETLWTPGNKLRVEVLPLWRTHSIRRIEKERTFRTEGFSI